MPSELGIRAAIEKAKEQERKYEWLEAAKSYEHGLHFESITTSVAAETLEKIGFCYSRASTQTEGIEEFKKTRQLAVEAYQNAARIFEKEDRLKNRGKSVQCYAIAEYIRSWLASSPPEKRKMLDECRLFGNRGLEAYKNAGEELNYGKMCNDLLLCLLERLYVASDWEEMRNIAQEGIDCADKAIAVLSKLGDKNELLRSYFTASLQSWYAANIFGEERAHELAQRSLIYSEKSLTLSKEVGDPYYIAMANWAAALCTALFTEKIDFALQYAKEMLRQGSIARDGYLKGIAYYVLALVTDSMTLREADPDKKKEEYENIIRYAEEATRYLHLVSQDFYIAGTHLYYAESCSSQAREIEAKSEEKRAMLGKAVEIGREGLEHASRSGSPDATGSTLHALSKALFFYSSLEVRKEEKEKLLEEALIHRKEYNKIVEKVFPSNDWIRGVGKYYEGLIEAELARIETDKDKKRVLLESSVSDMEDSMSRCGKWVLSRPVPTLMATVAIFEDSFGGILNDLYVLTQNQKTLERAIEVYENSAKEFKKVSLPSRAAESYWKMARNQDRLGRCRKAEENFENAFTEYKNAAQRIPNFAEFYLNHATFMKAWSEIERAKNAHERENYADAMKHYDKVASLLESSRLWSFMSSNFLAWAILEQAEDLSRRENFNESKEAFKKAAELFERAKEAFDKEIDRIENLDEREQTTELSKASKRRNGYCFARSSIEEARAFDLRGQHVESAEKYSSAASAFEKLLQTLETETDRKEMEPFVYICRAWQKMKMADVRASPELYREASELFLKAKEQIMTDKASLLISGNQTLCKALEFGTRFEATREKDAFSEAKKFLEAAANYYLKAGFENASLCTSATEILFDAFNYTVHAELEVDPEKKIRTYLVAEKCLERSSDLYEKAGYTGKRDEVLKTLNKVKEKHEFAISLRELLTTPSYASSTSATYAPVMRVEEPVGLMKFERAFIKANLIAHKKEVLVGESLGLEIQLANLGKKDVFLVGVEEIIPKGFDLVGKPEKCLIDDGILNLRRRKLAPLETEEMKLTLEPKRKGKYTLLPKISYMDETGEHKSCQLEQVTILVKEMGIRGWLKGPK